MVWHATTYLELQALAVARYSTAQVALGRSVIEVVSSVASFGHVVETIHHERLSRKKKRNCPCIIHSISASSGVTHAAQACTRPHQRLLSLDASKLLKTSHILHCAKQAEGMHPLNAPAASETSAEVTPESSPVKVEIAPSPAAVPSIPGCIDLQGSAIQALHTAEQSGSASWDAFP